MDRNPGGIRAYQEDQPPFPRANRRAVPRGRDLSEAESVIRETVSRFGRLEVLVNNAGTARDQLLARMSPEDFDGVIATNLRGTWNFCRAAIRSMLRDRWGRSREAGMTLQARHG